MSHAPQDHEIVSREDWLEARRALLVKEKAHTRARDADGQIFHTYSSYARGPEEMLGTLMILDRAPLGRNENGAMGFVRRHDAYEDAAKPNCCSAA